MLGYVAVQNLAAFVFDNEETIQHSEGHCTYGEEIEGSDYLTMILKKGEHFAWGHHGEQCDGDILQSVSCS